MGEPGSGASGAGRVWILDVDPGTGELLSGFSIGSGATNFTSLLPGDHFGSALANLGDWNGDGAPELGVGAPDDDGGADNGAVYLL